MARTVRDAKLETRTARDRLPSRARPYYRTLIPQALHLGYRRRRNGQAGWWVIRIYEGAGRYRRETIGLADDYQDADGGTILTYADAQEAAILRVKQGEEAGSRAPLTVQRAIELYIEFKKSEGKAVVDLVARVNAHIIPRLGGLEVSKLTSAKIRQWRAALASQRARIRTKTGQAQKFKAEPDSEEAVRRRQSSANRVLSILKAALNYVYDEKMVSTNDAWGRRVKPFKGVDAARIRYLTIAEARRLINACSPEFRPMVQAALQTGCRYSELTRLQVHDFNPDVKTLTIRRSKSGRTRNVVLTDEGSALFHQWCMGRSGSVLLLPKADATPWRASHQGRPMREACARAKLDPPVGFHTLRHTWASLSIMAGVPLMVVAENLGHVDTRMVEKHYGHLAASYVADAIRAGAPRFGIVGETNVRGLDDTRR